MDDDVAYAAAGDLDVRLRWNERADGGLLGALEVVNVSTRRTRVGSKPVIRPLGLDDVPLDAEHTVTLELRIPPYVDLEPGQRAVAGVSWAGWNGPPASGRFLVEWHGGEAIVTAEGPTQPEPTTGATNLSSTWFEHPH